MKDSPIQIGSIDLQDFEVPSSIRFGGRHRLAVHILSNGKRAVERLGPEDGEIVFSGTFSGPNAESRVKLFDNLRLSGEMVWLTWASFRRRVVVKSFAANYHSPWWIPYHIVCTVVHQSGVASAITSALEAQISADFGNALSAAAGSGLEFTALQKSLSGQNALVTGTSDQMQLLAAVGGYLDALDLEIAAQSAKLINSPASHAHRDTNIEAFATIVERAGSLAFAVATRSYIGRIGTHLNRVGN